MIDVSTMSSPILPVEVWLQVSRQLTYEGCKVAERLNRSFRELVAEPDLAAVRFVETEPNLIRRQALFKHEGLFPKRRVEGRFEPVAHLPDTAVLTNPLFRCVDWTPASTIDSLLVRWNIHGDWLERPIAIRTIDACEEAATSPAVKLLAVSIARVLEQTPDHRITIVQLPTLWIENEEGVRVIDVLKRACDISRERCKLQVPNPAFDGKTYGEILLNDLQSGTLFANLRVSFAEEDEETDDDDEAEESETEYLTVKIGRPIYHDPALFNLRQPKKSPIRCRLQELPLSVCALILAEVGYSGCKTLEACSRGMFHFLREVADAYPRIARMRFTETQPDTKALARIFRQADRHGLASSATMLQVHPLFACVDWHPTSTFDTLMVVRDLRGQKFTRPFRFASLRAQHEAATSLVVVDAVIRVDLRMAFEDPAAPSPPRDVMTPGTRVLSVGAVFRAWCDITATVWWHDDPKKITMPVDEDTTWGQRLALATLDPRAMIRRSLSISCPSGEIVGDEVSAFMLICEPSIRMHDDRRWQIERPKPPPLVPFPDHWWMNTSDASSYAEFEEGASSDGSFSYDASSGSSAGEDWEIGSDWDVDE